MQQFLDFVKTCQEDYQIAYSSVGDEDKRLQDLLHALEFSQDKYSMHREALKLWDSRNRRRRSKDTVQLCENIVQYFQSPAGKQTLKDLQQLLGRQRKTEQYLEGHREYRKRMVEG